MTDTPLRLAVIGLGMASRPHLPALRQLDGRIEVSGLYCRNATRRAEIAAQWGVPAHESLEEILDDPSVPAVILLTPPNARLDLTRKLASAGKHILMEKPLERRLEAAEQVVGICEDAGVQLGVVLQHRFRAGAQKLTSMLEDGSLGKLHLARLNLPWWRDQSYYDEPGRGTFEQDGGGVLLTQAIHLLDLMLSLTGPASEVQAMTATTGLHRMEGEDFASAGLRFANGAVGSVVATTASFPGRAEILELDTELAAVRLEAGRLEINWRTGESESFGETSESGGGSDPMDFPCDRHRALIEDFAQCLEENRPPRITGRDALTVHALIDAIERSALTGQRVEVKQG